MWKLAFCALVLQGIAGCFAADDLATGDGPFKEPLEPGQLAFSSFANKELQGYKLIRVVPKTARQLADLTTLLEQNAKAIEIDFWKEPSKVGFAVDMLASPENSEKLLSFLRQKGISYTILIDNISEAVDKENLRHAGTVFSAYSGFDYGRYHNLYEIHNELDNLARQHSNAQIFSIGRSYEGRTMKAIKITGASKPGKKTVFFNCAIHAREWITAATCMFMINQMLTMYRRDSTVKAMLDKVDWIVLPVLNVDGYAHTWNGGRARMWRKTRSRGYRCRGADPNRNWGYKWGGVGTSSSECSDIYRGRRAFSEIEVSNVANYLSRNKYQIAGYIDVHAYSQMWMTPWGYTKRYPSHYSEMMRVARAAVNALTSMYGTRYKVGTSSNIIYATSGGSDDWTYGALGIVYSYALELRDTGRYGFLLPANQIIPTGRETFAGFKAMASAMRSHAEGSYLVHPSCFDFIKNASLKGRLQTEAVHFISPATSCSVETHAAAYCPRADPKRGQLIYIRIAQLGSINAVCVRVLNRGMTTVERSFLSSSGLRAAKPK
eukprot:gene6276-6997_t